MARSKKNTQPDPSRYATTSTPRRAEALLGIEGVAASCEYNDGSPLEQPSQPSATAYSDQDESSISSDRSSQSHGAPEALRIPKLRKNWQELPNGLTEAQKKELSTSVMRVSTIYGIVANVHLSKLSQVDLSRLYTWIFDAHHVVMGDMNTQWRKMIGGAPLDYGQGLRKEPVRQAWVKPETHSAALREGGTYLPGVKEAQTTEYGRIVPITPPTFDMIVVHRPLSVEILPKQPGKRFVPAKIPRKQMLCDRWPTDGWPSDHTSVVASVQVRGASAALVVATWNVADPWYYSKWWPDAAFGFDRAKEGERCDAIIEHLVVLLNVADVVGLQEVPSSLVSRLVRLGTNQKFEVQCMSRISDRDEEQYNTHAGKVYSSANGLPETVPGCSFAMLFARDDILLPDGGN